MYKYLSDYEKVAFQAWKEAKDILPLEGEFADIILMLTRYDWSYHYSDDPSVWRSGEARSAKLKDMIDNWANPVEKEYLEKLYSKPSQMTQQVYQDFAGTYRESLLINRVRLASEGVTDETFNQLTAMRDELAALVEQVPKATGYNSHMGYFISNKRTNYAKMRQFAVSSGDQRFFGLVLPDDLRTAIVAVIKFMETKYPILKQYGYTKICDDTPGNGYKSVMPNVNLTDFHCYSDGLPEGVKAKSIFVNGHNYSYVA